MLPSTSLARTCAPTASMVRLERSSLIRKGDESAHPPDPHLLAAAICFKLRHTILKDIEGYAIRIAKASALLI